MFTKSYFLCDGIVSDLLYCFAAILLIIGEDFVQGTDFSVIISL